MDASDWLFLAYILPVTKGRKRLWIQPVDATDWLNRSAGVS
jgi:hypothetical protein